MKLITTMKCLLNQGISDIYKQKKKQNKQRKERKAMKYVFQCLEFKQLMLFIALTEWTSKVNNAGKKSYRTIEENGLVTQRMVAVIPDIQTQEDLSPNHWGEIWDQSVFQIEELDMNRRCDCQIVLGKECNKCKIYKERNYTEGHVLILIVTKNLF